MSKALFLSYPLHGHTNPTLGLVKELVERGETVIYYSTETFREKIENTGATFRKYAVEITNHDQNAKVSFADGVEELFAFFAATIGFGKAVMLSNIINEIKAENPDYIIHDSYAFWGKQIATACNISGISSVTTLVFNKRLVELEPDLFRNCFIKMSPEAMFKKYGVNTVLKMTDNLTDYFKSLFNMKDFDFFEMILNPEKLNIVYTSRLVQIHEECLDDSFKFVGPSIRPPENSLEFPLENLGDKPLVYISLGTTLNRRLDFYQKCITAFKDSDLQVVMSVGNKVEIKELGAIPANFVVKNYLPQLEVLKRASVFITHGGFNSSSEGIYYHVPLVIFPQNTDQFLVAERIEQLGAGIYVRNSQITAAELRELIGKVLSDNSFKKNCATVAESFKAAGGYRKAVDEIFQFKNSGKSGLNNQSMKAG